jgi:SAM-dependent methyltransferase
MKYHTFISYNSKNRREVEVIDDYLTHSGLAVFFDQRSISAGDKFPSKIEDALRESASILVIIGPQGVGPWQEEENYAFQVLQVDSGGDKRIIPVLLPGASLDPRSKDVPLFLRTRSYFKFDADIDDKDDLFNLVGILPKGGVRVGEMERPFLKSEQDRLLLNTIDFYDREAALYYSRWKDILPLPPMYAFLGELKRQASSMHVLDAGCGPGHHSNFFAEQGCLVTGIDLSARMIEIATKNKVERTTFIRADMRDLQRILKGRNLFDGIWACASCLHLTKEVFEWQLYEFTAVLKPSGVLGLSLQVGTPSKLQDDGRFFERYEEDELLDKVESHGFATVNINSQITNRNTLGTKQVKKWLNITAIAPNAKERLEMLKGEGRSSPS